ncbi:MAG: tetratricopeptide repeat protein, partial [Bacteroidia bacterium]
DTAMILSKEALQLSQKINWQPGIGQSYHQLGRFYNLKGDYSLSLQFYYKALDVWNQIENDYKQNKASTLGNIGIVYWSQGDSPKALDFYLKALKIDEELGNKKLIASVLSNIGILYTQEKDYAKALGYYLKALKMEEELDNKELIANTLSNIGTVYYEQKDFPQALDYYLKALRIGQELGDKNGIANWLSGIGNVYAEQKNYPEALAYFLKALNMTEALGDKNGMAMHLINIGSLYIKAPSLSSPIGEKKKGLALAEDYLQRALAISDKNGYLLATQECNEHLSELYEKVGNFGKALEHYKKAMAAKDTLFNADKNQEITRKAMTFEFEKKENEIKAEQDKKDAVAEADKKKQKIVIWSVLVGLLLVIVFAGFVFRSLRITRKQKNIIEEQKQLVEEHQKEILDSIHYAKRIQRALLASDNLLKKNLPDFFVLYKPKDIVSGDFYWALQANEIFLMLAGDCTGHGVPGAFMSLLNVSFLNEASIEKKMVSPDRSSIMFVKKLFPL